MGGAADWFQWQGTTLLLRLHVQPRARRDEVCGLHANRVKFALKAVPVDGKANRQLLAYLAAEFGVPRGQVEIASGERGRDKRIAVHGPRMLPEWFLGLGGAPAR